MKIKFITIFTTLTVLIAAAGFSSNAQAISNGLTETGFTVTPATSLIKRLFGGEQAAPKAQSGEITDKYREAFYEESEVYSTERFVNSPIKYEIRIPKDWEHTTESMGKSTEINSNLLDTLDHFQGDLIIGGGRASLTIQAIRLEHEILAAHWLQYHIFKNGHTSEKPIESFNENRAEAQYIFMKNGTSYHSFVKVFIVKDRLILVKFETPFTIEEKILAYGQLAVQNFQITSADIGQIEESRELHFANQLRLSYPLSWRPNNQAVRVSNRFSVDLHNETETGTLKGLVRIDSYRRTEEQTTQDIINGLRTKIKQDMGLKVDKLLNSAPLSVGLVYDIAHIERYEASREKSRTSEYELWVATLATDKWVTFIYLLTPTADYDYYNWARNTRMLDIMLNSVG